MSRYSLSPPVAGAPRPLLPGLSDVCEGTAGEVNERRILPADNNRKRRVERAVRNAAEAHHRVRLRYRKLTTNERVTRYVDPYSYRYVRPKGQGRYFKWLYAYHPGHESIEMYLVRNIYRADETEASYTPTWEVEIGG